MKDGSSDSCIGMSRSTLRHVMTALADRRENPNDGLAQPVSDGIDQVRSNGPAKRASGNRRGNPLPKGCPTRGLAIGDRDELEIGVAGRDNPVRRAPRRMTSTLNGRQPIPLHEPGRLER
jgi:hypothetical protein